MWPCISDGHAFSIIMDITLCTSWTKCKAILKLILPGHFVTAPRKVFLGAQVHVSICMNYDEKLPYHCGTFISDGTIDFTWEVPVLVRFCQLDINWSYLGAGTSTEYLLYIKIACEHAFGIFYLLVFDVWRSMSLCWWGMSPLMVVSQTV